MEAGRQKAMTSKMQGCVNVDDVMTDIYLPRKCDFTDRMIPSKDHSSIQLSICDVPLPNPGQLGRHHQPWQKQHHHHLRIRPFHWSG
ncbi:MAG: 40S ribosomal protein S21 [Bdellovibrionales bacterium]|nr:40S ribosomal protein S21 [Bdellovibrionales bacterium]